MTPSFLLSLGLILLLSYCCRTVDATKNILILGDSWGTFADEELLESLCEGTSVRNMAMGGTTAQRWARGGLLDLKLLQMQVTNYEPDVAWIVLGGNEFIYAYNQDCMPDGGAAGVAEDLLRVIDKLTKRFPSIQILMTGYAVPSADIIGELSDCDALATLSNLQSVFEDYLYTNNTIIEPIVDWFGGSLTDSSYELSNPELFQDQIHLNDEGYTLLWTNDKIQSALQCGTSNGDDVDDDSNPIFCFPETSTVEVEGRGAVAMKDLALGDRIAVGEGKYEPIYSFGHRHASARGKFLQLKTETGGQLVVSHSHLVEILRETEGPQSSQFVAASDVKVGTRLVMDGSEPSPVVAIQNIQKQGLYAPFTYSGKLLVDGISVSSYATLLPNDRSKLDLATNGGLGLSVQWLAHQFQFPHRLYCTYIESCKTERYTENGISTWVDGPMQVFLWLFSGNAKVPDVALGFIVLAMASLLWIAEFVLVKSTLLTAVVAVTGSTLMVAKRSKQQ